MTTNMIDPNFAADIDTVELTNEAVDSLSELKQQCFLQILKELYPAKDPAMYAISFARVIELYLKKQNLIIDETLLRLNALIEYNTGLENEAIRQKNE